jgi:hypothetical protein
MKRPTGLFRSLIAAAAASFAVAASAVVPAASETIVYAYPALPGPVGNCQWFNDNVNDRSIDAIVRQTDLLYNRVALTPDTPVTVTQTATTALGAQLVQFDLGRRLLCAGAQALHPELPEPSPPPPEP